MKKKKFNYFQIFLILLLIGSLIMYGKLYIYNSDIDKVVDLPNIITKSTWYEYDSLASMQFNLGDFKYTSNNDKIKDISMCKRYYYDDKNQLITFDCNKYSMKIISSSEHKLVIGISINNKLSETYIYYNSLELVNYLIDNNMKDISEEEILEIIKNNNFANNNKEEKSAEYKEAQLSKLSAINEISINDFLNLKDKKAMILLINPNIDSNSYDFIPIYLNWKNQYSDYSFYYINGNMLSVADYDLLENTPMLKEYLTGLHNISVLILKNDEYQRVSIDINTEKTEEVFNCVDTECDNVDLKIYNDEKVYNTIDELLDN